MHYIFIAVIARLLRSYTDNMVSMDQPLFCEEHTSVISMPDCIIAWIYMLQFISKQITKRPFAMLSFFFGFVVQ